MEFEFFTSANLILKVDKSGSVAYLKIKDINAAIQENELLDILDNAGVVYGFERAKKQRKNLDDFFVIALADPSNSYWKTNFYKKIPTIKDLTLDNIQKLPFVKKNEIIGDISPANKSNVSLNVFGKPNLNQRKIIINADENFYISDHKIYTNQDGYIYFDTSGKLKILSFFVENNDVYKKNLSLKIKVVFQKDLLASEIESTQDIVINGVIRDCKKVFSKSSISFNTAVDSKIISEQNIYFAGRIIDSKLIAKDCIIGKNDSEISSGNLISGKTIEVCKVLRKSETTLEIALAPVQKELITMNKEKNNLFSKDKKLLNEIEKEFYNYDYLKIERFIKIKKKVVPNVYLRVLNNSKIIKKTISNLLFS